jgi:hypothetical protein
VAVRRLADAERASLGRRFDAAAIVVGVLFMVPGFVLAGWAWSLDT